METVHADLKRVYNYSNLNSSKSYLALEVNFHRDFEIKEHEQMMLLDTNLEVGVAARVVQVLDSGNAVVKVRGDDFFVLDRDDIAAEKIPGREDSVVTLLPDETVGEGNTETSTEEVEKINVAALLALGVVMLASFAAAMVAILI